MRPSSLLGCPHIETQKAPKELNQSGLDVFFKMMVVTFKERLLIFFNVTTINQK
jgi:hypothetical protein